MKIKKLLFVVLSALILSDCVSAYAFTQSDIDALYAYETDDNVHSMGIKMLRKELGLDVGDDVRTIGTFHRSTNDFITMTSLINVKRQTVRDLNDDTFTLRLGNYDKYDNAYYSDRAQDLDLLLYHINSVKTLTQGLDDKSIAAFIDDYICDRFSFQNQCELAPSAVSGFKTGASNCRGYTASFYIIGRNCGLNVSAECAHNSSGTHTYNIINLNGTNYVVDSSANDLYSTKEYLLIPYNTYMQETNSIKIRDSLADLDT